jgi:hypothetical protein
MHYCWLHPLQPARGRMALSEVLPSRVACNAGFGRIGRLVLRATLNRKDVNVVAINGKPLPGQPGLCAVIPVTSCQQG